VAKSQSHEFFLYKPGVQLPDLFEFVNQTIEVRIGTEYINKHNQALLTHQIWGSETYTSHSDAVCILLHHGFISDLD